MKRVAGILLLLFLSTQLYALTLSDIIRLSKANVGDDIILSVIAVSETELQLTTDDIIRLKNEGVSNKVITALVKSTAPGKKAKKRTTEKRPRRRPRREKRRQEREMSPFDQFFLSTYYSHEYGWPEPNYRNTEDILRQGLYYQGPTHYPNARNVRLYGFGHSYSPRTGYTFSPYSIIVPRRHLHNGYNQFPPYRRHHYRYKDGKYYKHKHKHDK